MVVIVGLVEMMVVAPRLRLLLLQVPSPIVGREVSSASLMVLERSLSLLLPMEDVTQLHLVEGPHGKFSTWSRTLIASGIKTLRLDDP